MKVWILNNTKLDKKKDWENYFESEFIPKLEKYSKDGDIVLHLGHIFNNSELVSVKSINKLLYYVNKVSEIRPFYFLDGYDTELLKLIKSIKNTIIVDKPLLIEKFKLIPKKFNIIEHIEGDIVIINSQIDQSLLENYKQDFYCGFYDMKSEKKNIINVGTPYQLDKKSSAGFYVVDSSKKKKYFKNEIDISYNIIRITNIKQIEELDKEFISKNNISVEIDKSLIDDKKVKIDVLLNDYDFKKISYINDDENIDIIDNNSLKMEDLLLEKIKNSDNENLLPEFENILKIFKEKY